MKVLHTSDWHLGHAIYNDSLEAAQADMLSQIAAIVSDKKPDVLIIAGDVYDTTQPSAGIQQVFADAIVKMHEAHRDMTIVCIAGNHDSGSKHMIYHTPWRALNVHVIGNIVKDSDLEDYIIEIPGKGYVAAVPFAADRYMPDDVFEVLADKVGQRNTHNLPVFLTAHLAVSSSDWRGHEFSSDTNIGGLNCQDLAVLGDAYDYVALGHIHKQQSLDKDRHIWYSGTPIAVSFDEVYPGNEHGVLFVECAAHRGGVEVQNITLKSIRPLVNIPDEGYAEWSVVKKMLSEYDADIPSLVRLNVAVEHYLPVGAYDEARAIADTKTCSLCYINSHRKESDAVATEVRNLTTAELKHIDYMEVAEMYIKSQGEAFDNDMKSMLQEVREMLNIAND